MWVFWRMLSGEPQMWKSINRWLLSAALASQDTSHQKQKSCHIHSIVWMLVWLKGETRRSCRSKSSNIQPNDRQNDFLFQKPSTQFIDIYIIYRVPTGEHGVHKQRQYLGMHTVAATKPTTTTTMYRPIADKRYRRRRRNQKLPKPRAPLYNIIKKLRVE